MTSCFDLTSNRMVSLTQISCWVWCMSTRSFRSWSLTKRVCRSTPIPWSSFWWHRQNIVWVVWLRQGTCYRCGRVVSVGRGDCLILFFPNRSDAGRTFLWCYSLFVLGIFCCIHCIPFRTRSHVLYNLLLFLACIFDISHFHIPSVWMDCSFVVRVWHCCLLSLVFWGRSYAFLHIFESPFSFPHSG